MQSLELPDELVARLRRRAADGCLASEAEVIRAALDSLDQRDSELAAIQAGYDAMLNGHTRPYDEFRREISDRLGLGED